MNDVLSQKYSKEFLTDLKMLSKFSAITYTFSTSTIVDSTK